jgi:hypothetical protein
MQMKYLSQIFEKKKPNSHIYVSYVNSLHIPSIAPVFVRRFFEKISPSSVTRSPEHTEETHVPLFFDPI